MSDELDPLLEGIEDEELLPKKKRGASDDDLDEFGDELDIDDIEDDPFLSDLGFGFGTEDEEVY
jgi:hypothetical protein